MFQVGDTVILPHHGAGTVTDIEELQVLGSDNLYYSIKLFDESKTFVWIPVKDAEKQGVRHPIRKSQLGQIWRVLRAEPQELPTDHNKRYEFLLEKLCGGNLFQVAEAVKDLFWRNHCTRNLTIKGKRLYDRGMMFLASEVAVVQGSDFAVAEARISDILGTSLASRPAV